MVAVMIWMMIITMSMRLKGMMIIVITTDKRIRLAGHQKIINWEEEIMNMIHFTLVSIIHDKTFRLQKPTKIYVFFYTSLLMVTRTKLILLDLSLEVIWNFEKQIWDFRDNKMLHITKMAKMTGGTPEVRSVKRLTLLTFNIWHSTKGPMNQ